MNKSEIEMNKYNIYIYIYKHTHNISIYTKIMHEQDTVKHDKRERERERERERIQRQKPSEVFAARRLPARKLCLEIRGRLLCVRV